MFDCIAVGLIEHPEGGEGPIRPAQRRPPVAASRCPFNPVLSADPHNPASNLKPKGSRPPV